MEDRRTGGLEGRTEGRNKRKELKEERAKGRAVGRNKRKAYKEGTKGRIPEGIKGRNERKE